MFCLWRPTLLTGINQERSDYLYCYIIGLTFSKWDPNGNAQPIGKLNPFNMKNTSVYDRRFNDDDMTGFRVFNLKANEYKDIPSKICLSFMQAGVIMNDSIYGAKNEREVSVGISQDYSFYGKIVKGIERTEPKRYILGTAQGLNVCYNPRNKEVFFRTDEQLKAQASQEKTPFYTLSQRQIPDTEFSADVLEKLKKAVADNEKPSQSSNSDTLDMANALGVFGLSADDDAFTELFSYKPTQQPNYDNQGVQKDDKKYQDVKQLIANNADKIPEIDKSLDAEIKQSTEFAQSTSLRKVLRSIPNDIQGARETDSVITLSRRNRRGGVENYTLSVDDAMQFAIGNMRVIDPYMWVALKQLKVLGTQDLRECDTLAVAMDKDGYYLYYNIDFVARSTRATLDFFVLHEAYHFIMKHLGRGRKKDRFIWNFVTDLFVNGWIIRNYNLPLDGSEVALQRVQDTKNGPETITTNVTLAVPQGCIYSPELDVSKETPEAVYKEIMDNIQKEMQDIQNAMGGTGDKNSKPGNTPSNASGPSAPGGQTQGGNSDTNSGENNQGQGGPGNQGNQPGGQSGGQGNQQGGQSGRQGNQQGNNQNSGNGQGNGQNSSEQSSQTPQQNKSNQHSDNGSKDAVDEYNEQYSKKTLVKKVTRDDDGNVTSVTIDFRGKEYEYNVQNLDLSETEKGVDDTDEQASQRANDMVVTTNERAKAFSIGKTASSSLRGVDAVDPVRDTSWQRFMAKYMNEMSKKGKSYRNPNRKMLSLGHLVKGDVKVDPDMLNGVYICIDTSASVGSKELGLVFSYLQSTLRKYGMKGHIVYWDTDVRAVGEFTNAKEMLRARELVRGGGGTDPSCLYQYFASKQCKPKPKLVLIMTDGYFADFKPEQYRKYGETIWVIPSSRDDYKRFKAPFGKKAPLRLYE